jgi:hypothetical protein
MLIGLDVPMDQALRLQTRQGGLYSAVIGIPGCGKPPCSDAFYCVSGIRIGIQVTQDGIDDFYKVFFLWLHVPSSTSGTGSCNLHAKPD